MRSLPSQYTKNSSSNLVEGCKVVFRKANQSSFFSSHKKQRKTRARQTKTNYLAKQQRGLLVNARNHLQQRKLRGKANCHNRSTSHLHLLAHWHLGLGAARRRHLRPCARIQSKVNLARHATYCSENSKAGQLDSQGLAHKRIRQKCFPRIWLWLDGRRRHDNNGKEVDNSASSVHLRG